MLLLFDEFFDAILRQLNDSMFEGCGSSRIPNKDNNIQHMFATA